MKHKKAPRKGPIWAFSEQFPLREMEPGFAAPSAGAEEGHGLADAFDSVIRDLRSSKQLSTQAGGGPISSTKVSPPLALRPHQLARMRG